MDDSPDSVANPVAGHTYTASAYVRTDNSVGKAVQLVLRQRGGSVAARSILSTAVTLSTTWKRITVSGTVDAGRTSLDVYVYQSAAVTGNRIHVDDIELINNSAIATPTPAPTPAPTPTPTPAPTPAPTPGSITKLFNANSPFNLPIPANATIDPNSALMRNSLVGDARARGAVITWKEWSIPVYIANASTPRYSVTLEKYHISGYRFLDNVPIPTGAVPQNKADGHMTILDQSTGCVYDFWQMRQASGSWYTSWGNRMSYVNDNGIYPKGASAKGSGFSNLAGLILPSDIAGTNEIEHALFFASGVNRSGGPVAPATESDGPYAGVQYIPEGARIRLRADFNLSSYSVHLQKIGRALKKYGAYNGDNSGGGFTLYAIDTTASPSTFGYGTVWPWGTTTYPAIPIEFIENLEVLTMGPQQVLPIEALQHPCGAYRR